MKRTNNVIVIARKELRESFSTKIFWLFAAVIWLLILFGGWSGWQRQQAGRVQRKKAADLFRHEWEEQKANPHSAAHFGTYLFKPSSIMEMYDNGLNSFLGNTYRVEAHVQHEVNHSEAEHADTYLRFGDLSVALVFQLLVPLMILLITFNTITKEREGNTLKILATQGASPSAVVKGKICGNYLIILVVVLPAMLLLACPLLFGTHTGNGAATRYLLFCILYLVYFFVFVSIGTFLSSVSRSSAAALTAGLGIWIVFAILLPRGIARWVDASYPLPSRYAFNRNITQGYQKGMNNEGSASERYNQYLQQTLMKYKVDSVTQLPLNFDGLSMQFGEDYNSKVYDHFSGEVEATIRKQQNTMEILSIVDPFLATQQLSMCLAGTDYFDHLHFHHRAKEYRNEFVRVLNLDLANSGSAYQSYDYKVGPDFFKKMKDFHYSGLSLSDSLSSHKRTLIAMACWLLVSCVLFIPLTIRFVKV